MERVALTYMKVQVLVTQSSWTLCDPIDCSPPGSSVHGILQARILECIVIPFSRGPSRPRSGTRVSCIAGRFFTTEPSGTAPVCHRCALIFVEYYRIVSPLPHFTDHGGTPSLQPGKVSGRSLGFCGGQFVGKQEWEVLNHWEP